MIKKMNNLDDQIISSIPYIFISCGWVCATVLSSHSRAAFSLMQLEKTLKLSWSADLWPLTVAHRLRCFLHIDTDDFFVHCCFGSVLLVTRWLFSLVLHRLPWINTSILSHHSSSLCLSFIDPTRSRVGRNFSSTRSWTSSCTTCTIISEGFTLFHSSLLIQIYSVPDSQQDSTRA